MKQVRIRALPRLLLAMSLLASGVYLLAFFWVVAQRIHYPYVLEWLEGDEFHHAWRMLHGLSWYPPPSLEFFPAYYPPGYPAVCAAAMSLFGSSLTTMRWVSVLCTLVCLLSMLRIVQRQTQSFAYGCLSVGLFVATYSATEAWFDVGRVDMLGMALVLSGLALAHRRSSRLGFVVGFLLLSLASLVKQSHLLFALGFAALWMVWDHRRGFLALALSAVVALGLTMLLQLTSGGWYLFYTWHMPRGAEHDATGFWQYWRELVQVFAGWCSPLVLFAVITSFRSGKWKAAPMALLPVALLVSLMARTNVGGAVNNLIPAMSFVAMVSALALADLAARTRSRFYILALVLVALQFIHSRYDARSLRPTAVDSVQVRRVVEHIQALPKPVLAPYHPYLLHLAGQPMQAHYHIINELYRMRGRGIEVDDNGLLASFRRDLATGRWRSYVSSQHAQLGELRFEWTERAAQSRFRRHEFLVPAHDPNLLYAVSGNRVRPFSTYLADSDATPSR